MRKRHSPWALTVLLGALAPSSLVGCGDADRPPERPEVDDCERYGTCDDVGPFGDGDYEEWGGDDKQGGDGQEQQQTEDPE